MRHGNSLFWADIRCPWRVRDSRRKAYNSAGFASRLRLIPAERLVFSRRLAAVANATEIRAGTDSKTQKSPDLVPRKAVGCNTLLGRSLGFFTITKGQKASNIQQYSLFVQAIRKRNARSLAGADCGRSI